MTRRQLLAAAVLASLAAACSASPEAPEPPTTPAPAAVLIPPASCRQTPTGPFCDPPDAGPDPRPRGSHEEQRLTAA